MDKFYIDGPNNLSGEVKISGSKNSALPILIASLLTSDSVELKNIPILKDIQYAIKLLMKLGVKIIVKKNIYIHANSIKQCHLPYYLTKKIRASIWILAPLLARFGEATIALPGGCNIGNRKIDLHILGLKQLGANISIKNNYIKGSVKKKLIGTSITFFKISVGATITIMSAATLANGITTITNAAREPEIIDLANFLNTLGANIIGAGSKKIIIKGVLKLHGGSYKIMPDRIETGTFLVAAAISHGNIVCYNTDPKILKCVLIKLHQTGAIITTGKNWINLNMKNRHSNSINIKTSPYPGFPTDMQALFTLLNLVSKGHSKVTETIFDNRFQHISELKKMGVNAIIKNDSVLCYGVKKLIAATVYASDLRAAASLVLAGCIAYGRTTIYNTHYIQRGYENFHDKLNLLGAQIKK